MEYLNKLEQLAEPLKHLFESFQLQYAHPRLQQRLPFITQSFASFIGGFSVGWYLVKSLRHATQQRSQKSIFLLSLLLFLVPIIGYLGLLIMSLNNYLHKHQCDFLTLGIVIGILYNFTYFPKQKLAIQVVVEEVSGKRVELWLNSIDITVRQLQEQIADAFTIAPSRVAIESGKGTIIEDLDRPFPSIISESVMSSDSFDGHLIITCYITILDEVPDNDETTSNVGSPRALPFYQGLLSNRVDVKYSTESFYLTARVHNASADAKAFIISSVEKFAAASPQNQLLFDLPVKIIPWKDDDEASSASDAGDHPLPPGPGPNQSTTPNKPFWRKKITLPGIMKAVPSQQVRNGDMIVLECDGKYISVTRGWWLSWSATAPRRSGAFIVEIIEKAPQNKIIETFNKMRRPTIAAAAPITQSNLQALNQPNSQSPNNLSSFPVNNSIVAHPSGGYSLLPNPMLAAPGGGQMDDVLYTGDTFRLRSVKFPDYEFGVTNTRINDSYCYTGLRKIGDNTSGDDWCMGVNFSFKAHTLGSQLIKQAANIPGIKGQ